MTRYLGPLLCALVAAACSNSKPAESPYDTTTVAKTDSSEPELVPASSDVANEPADRTTASESSHANKSAHADSAHQAPDTIPPAAAAADKSPSNSPNAGAAPDNTKVNKRDTKDSALTPMDQGQNATDLEITQQIRKAVVADGSLSFNAKNVKIITVDGKVTLRGPVKNAAERQAIEAAARKVAGAGKVDSQLEIAN